MIQLSKCILPTKKQIFDNVTIHNSRQRRKQNENPCGNDRMSVLSLITKNNFNYRIIILYIIIITNKQLIIDENGQRNAPMGKRQCSAEKC